MPIITTSLKFLIQYRWFVLLGFLSMWIFVLSQENNRLELSLENKELERKMLVLAMDNYTTSQAAITNSTLLSTQIQYSENLKSKEKEIETLNRSISSSNIAIDSLYQTLNQYTMDVVSNSDPVANQTTIQHITFLDRLYREALENGRESSSAVEEVKLELRHCMADIDSIYTSNKTNSIGSLEES